MFSSEPLLKNRLAIKRAELRHGLRTSNACQLESNWATLNRWRLVQGVWAARGPECQRRSGEARGPAAAVTGTEDSVQMKSLQKSELRTEFWSPWAVLVLKGIKFDCVIILDGVWRGSNPLIVLITANTLVKVHLTLSVKLKHVLT